jgi:hypothetical protein
MNMWSSVHDRCRCHHTSLCSIDIDIAIETPRVHHFVSVFCARKKLAHMCSEQAGCVYLAGAAGRSSFLARFWLTFVDFTRAPDVVLRCATAGQWSRVLSRSLQKAY